MFYFHKISRILLIKIFCFIPFIIFSNPEGASVVSGDVEISKDNNFLQINSSDRAIVNWENFSIAKNETTKFVLPSSKASVLNRVVGVNLSKISGKLESNGFIYLINKNGIYIDESGVINSAGFLASTLSIDDMEFLKNGDLRFFSEDKAFITNKGKINTWDSDVILLSYVVKNEGSISSSNGKVAMGAGKEIVLSPEGNDILSIRISSKDMKPEEYGIDQKGIIEALEVDLKADGNLYSYAINHEGVIKNFDGVKKENGRVFLTASEGVVSLDGRIDLSNDEGVGGEVRALGKGVWVKKNTRIDVSGKFGGGEVLIGGDYQGKNPDILNSDKTIIEEGVKIFADATERGDGGKVIVWGNDLAAFYGEIFSRGGPSEGDGGFTELSSLGYLHPKGYVDLTAVNGNTGMLLLDPSNITISTAATANINWSGGSPDVATGTASSATLQISDMLTHLQAASVTVDASGGGATGSGRITISNDIPITNLHDGNTLYIKAHDYLYLYSAASITSTNSSANLILEAGNDGNGNIYCYGSVTFDSDCSGDFTMRTASGQEGTILINDPISFSSSGNFSISAGTDLTISDSITVNNAASVSIDVVGDDLSASQPLSFTDVSGAVSLSSESTLTLNNTVTVNNVGSLSISSAGDGIYINGAVSISNVSGTMTLASFDDINISDSISLNATGTFSLDAGRDINLNDSILNSSSGDINVTTVRTFYVGDGTQNNAVQIGSENGDMTLDIGASIHLNGGDTANAFVQIGYFDSGSPSDPISSNIYFTNVGDNFTISGGSATNCYAVVGHGSGISGSGNRTGNITIDNIDGNLILQGGSVSGSFAQMGHIRGEGGAVVVNGNISVTDLDGTLEVKGGTATDCYAMIGHGGKATAYGDSYTGNVQLVAKTGSSDLFAIFAGSALGAFASFGHMAYINAAATVTINSTLINLQSENDIIVSMNSNSEASIGSRVVTSGVGASGTVSVTNLNITTQNLGNFYLYDNVSTLDYHGIVIGAFVNTDQQYPPASSGTASVDINLTVDGNLIFESGTDDNMDAFCYVINGCGSPVGGPYSIIGNVTGDVVVHGGYGIATLTSIDTLTLNAGGYVELYAINGTDSQKTASIESNGNTSISASTIYMKGKNTAAQTFIDNSTGTLDFTLSGDMDMDTNSRIELSGGVDDLTATIGGNLLMGANSIIENSGSGDIDLDITGYAQLRGEGLSYDAFIQSAAALTLDSQQICLYGISNGRAYISSSGDTTITTGDVVMRGSLSSFPSLITNSQGDLSMTIASLYMNYHSYIELTGGSGKLTLTTSDDLSLGENCYIDNSSSGGDTEITVGGISTIKGEGGVFDSYIKANSTLTFTTEHALTLRSYQQTKAEINSAGNSDIQARNIFLIGSQANIVDSTGNLNVEAGSGISLGNKAKIRLTGGNGTLTVDAGSSSSGILSVCTGSLIKNEGTGLLLLKTGDNCNVEGSVNNMYISSGGDLTANIGATLNVSGSCTGGVIFESNGDLTVTAGCMSFSGGDSSHYSWMRSITGNLSISLQSCLMVQRFAYFKVGGGTGGINIVTGLGGVGDFTLLNSANILNEGSGDTNITVGNSFFLNSGCSGAAYVENTGGGNLNISASSLALTGTDYSQYIKTDSGDITVITQGNIAVRDSSYIQSGGSLTLVVDQQSPSSPGIGNGRFYLNPDSNLISEGVLRSFTAVPSQNLIFGKINGISFSEDSQNQQYNTYYDTFLGGGGVPFTIYYKVDGVSPNFSTEVTTFSSEFFDIFEEFREIEELKYDQFCLKLFSEKFPEKVMDLDLCGCDGGYFSIIKRYDGVTVENFLLEEYKRCKR